MNEKKIKVLHIFFSHEHNGEYEIIRRLEMNMKNTEFYYLSPVKIYDFPNAFNLNIKMKSFKSKIIYNYRVYSFLKKHKYDIVHINGGKFFRSFSCALICRLLKIKKIVVHSHSCTNLKKRKKALMKILNPLYRKITNVHLTCSISAAKALFTKLNDVIIIKNGLTINNYRYNENIRNEYRKKLAIENKIVYGHVARFSKTKNQDFTIDVFNKIQNHQDALLLLIGIGKTEESIKKKVKELNIENKVLFLGFRTDVDKLLNSMDFFILPSINEGLGNVVIESLTSGLPTFVSNGIPEEANVSRNFHRINSFDASEWAKEILNTKPGDRVNAYKDIIKAGFDIKDSARELEQIYKNLMEQEI